MRTEGEKTDVLDGPYADTKEQFAGYFFIDVPTLEEAVAWAKRCPSSRFGSIEIRPLHVPKGELEMTSRDEAVRTAERVARESYGRLVVAGNRIVKVKAPVKMTNAGSESYTPVSNGM